MKGTLWTFHPPQQNVFHSLIYRIKNTLLSEERFQKEFNNIKNVAKCNGYKTMLIHIMLRKAQNNHLKRSKATLLPLKKKNKTKMDPYYLYLNFIFD